MLARFSWLPNPVDPIFPRRNILSVLLSTTFYKTLLKSFFSCKNKIIIHVCLEALSFSKMEECKKLIYRTQNYQIKHCKPIS